MMSQLIKTKISENGTILIIADGQQVIAADSMRQVCHHCGRLYLNNRWLRERIYQLEKEAAKAEE